MEVPQIFISTPNFVGNTDQCDIESVHSYSQECEPREQCSVEEDPEPVKKSLNVERYLLHSWKSIGPCLEKSTLHGLPFLPVSSRAKPKLLLWMATVTIAILLMVYSLSAVSTKYTSGKTYASNNRRFPKELPFPAITICNLNPFKISAILGRNMSLLQANLLLNYIRSKDNTSLPISYFSTLVQQYDTATGGNSSLYKDLGHKLEDYMLSCTFDGRRCSPANFTARATSSGLCYTFNPNGDFTHYHSLRHGYRYGLIIRMNIEQYEHFVSEVTSAGFNVFIHDHDHFPYSGNYRRLLISPGKSILLSITKTEYTRLPAPTGICSDHVVLTMFKSYSRESCLIECETHFVIKTCGCKAEYMPGNEITCSLNQTLYCILPLTKTFQFEQCDCPISCNSVVFDAHISYSNYPASHLIDVYNNSYFLQSGVFPLPRFAIRNYTDANGTVISYLPSSINTAGAKANYVKIGVFYEAQEYNVVSEELQYTLGRFVADFTGFIGIFIGAGFLSCFEVLELISSFINPPS